ncbi:hypothetical protein CsSME_00030853 [Camellia sinensis var. sinensis]
MIIDKSHEAVPGKPIATSSSPRASTVISPSPDPRKQSPPADLYVNDRLTIHGIDGILDPNSVSKCMFSDQTLLIKYRGIDPSPSQSQSRLDYAVKAMSKRGFSMVATAMAVKRSNLINLDAITVFAPSDSSLFSESNGFRFDFLRHVVPGRLETLSPHKKVVI